MSESLIVREPVFIESNGQRVAVLLPIAVYESLLSGRTTSSATMAPDSETDPTVQAISREQDAFCAMHAQLREKFSGQFVAVYRGQMVDHDPDQYSLFQRVDAKFPSEPVLIQQVLEDCREVYHLRSPRLAHDG